MCKALHWGCNARDLSCYQQMPQLFPMQLRSGGGISYSVVQKAQARMAFHNRHCVLVQESPLLLHHRFPQGGQGHAGLTGDSGVWSSEVLSPILVSTTAGPELPLGAVGRRGAHGSCRVHRVALQTETRMCRWNLGQAALGLTLLGGLRSFPDRISPLLQKSLPVSSKHPTSNTRAI